MVTHGGGGFGCRSTFAVVPDEKLAVIVLFNYQGGYNVSARDLLDECFGAGFTGLSSADEKENDICLITGAYKSSWRYLERVLNEITIGASEKALEASMDGRIYTLAKLPETVCETDDGSGTIGFVPGGEYLMCDGFGIGLVSAWP